MKNFAHNFSGSRLVDTNKTKININLFENIGISSFRNCLTRSGHNFPCLFTKYSKVASYNGLDTVILLRRLKLLAGIITSRSGLVSSRHVPVFIVRHLLTALHKLLTGSSCETRTGRNKIPEAGVGPDLAGLDRAAGRAGQRRSKWDRSRVEPQGHRHTR